MKAEKELLGLAGNKPTAPFSHRIRMRERRGALGKTHQVMPLAFPRNGISSRTFKIFYVIFLESANATISCISSIEKTAFSYHLQNLHIVSTDWLVICRNQPSPCSDLLLLLKVANLTHNGFKSLFNSPFCDSAILSWAKP